MSRRVVVAPAPFKGALSGPDAARAIAAGVRLTGGGVRTVLLPLADGGEGTAEALISATEGVRKVATVEDPLGRPVSAGFGLLKGSTAVVELAQASGYERLTEDERNPERTTTFGAGQLIRAALDHSPRRILVGVGGSATTDAAMGIARALGVRFHDRDGVELNGSGADLARVAAIDRSSLDPRLEGVEIEVACDVDNPFCGPDGAARVFGPQKGADPSAVERLDSGLESFAAVLARECGVEVAALPRAGAAGGAAGGMAALLGARLRDGASVVLDALDFDEALTGATLVITGEGTLDEQSLAGKAPVSAARRARAAGVPCIALCGAVALGPGRLHDAGIDAAFPIGRRQRPLPDALAETERDLAAAGAAVGGMLAALSERYRPIG